MARYNVNKAILIGNLGGDPELRYTSNNMPVVNFTVATNESWVNKEGVREERTEWHRVIAWGRLAEICNEKLHKGSQVYVEGRIQTRSWEDQSGQKRFVTEIVANEMVILGGRSGEGTSQAAGGERKKQASPAQGTDESYDDFQPPEQDVDDDLPF
ncbi:MAG: single-stranded DNA-binding protein [Candidatus Glassbacteria bacterium]|nr:single-stranded DNA-binding protein [Candidatus Glassbacteria bacterium]